MPCYAGLLLEPWPSAAGFFALWANDDELMAVNGWKLLEMAVNGNKFARNGCKWQKNC